VVTTPFTFIATGEMISLLGAKPVFVDIDPVSFNIVPDAIEAAITDRTKAIMPVSLLGQCADMDRINAVAGRQGLPVIEDGAQTFDSLNRGGPSCGMSTSGCTCSVPSQPLGCYRDGGAGLPDVLELARRMREIRAQAQARRYPPVRIRLNRR